MLKPDIAQRLRARIDACELDADTEQAIGDAIDELERLRAQEVPTVEDINAQRWTGMDGTTAFHLIERHGDDWWHCGRLMEAWRAANSPAAPAQQAESPCACWPGRMCSRSAACAADVRAQQADQAPAPAPDLHHPDTPHKAEFDALYQTLCVRSITVHEIARRCWKAGIAAGSASPAVTHGSDMLEPLIYAAMMHNGKPKTVAEFERVAANVADMLQRRAADAHEKPVASIYISADGSREFDDWRVDLPPGNHQLFTAPRPAQPQPESLPHPGAPEAEEMIDKLLAEYNRPANMKNAARAGYMAARRLLQNARQPLPAVEDAEPIGWGGVIETCAELCDPHFIAQQDLDELKRYAGNWNSTYRFFPIYAPGAQLTEGPAVLAERDALKAAIVELNAAEFAYARYIRSDGLEKHRQNRERRIAAWQAARKLVGADGSNVPVQNKEPTHD